MRESAWIRLLATTAACVLVACSPAMSGDAGDAGDAADQVSMEVGPDAPGDAAPDSVADVAPDALPDVALDVPSDAIDVAVDVVGDATPDATLDVATDAPPADTSADATDAGGTEAYTAALSGAEEVPTVSTAANGTATFTYTPATRELRWTLTFTGITPTAAHVHGSPAGTNGAVIVALATTSGATGTATLTATQEVELRAGNLYVNVHSAAFPGGEIRGQILRPGERLFVARLSGLEEVPRNASTASGVIAVILNAARNAIRYRGSASITPTAAHIHTAGAGSNGGVAHALTMSGANFDGSAAITVTDATDLDATRWYVNVHTAAFPGGEIRGQILRPGSTLFVATLTGAQEVPAVTTTATGAASAVLGYRSGVVQYVYSASFLPTAAHIHRAIGGRNGAVAHALANAMAASGTVTLAGAEPDQLRNGGLYVNLHTTANPGGELRGQLLEPGQVLYTALLSGANEVPPVTSSSSGATAAILSASGTSLTYASEIAPALTAPTAAHIHNAATGTNGPVVHTLTLVSGAPAGMLTINATDVMRLDASTYYVNIHTTAFPGGELRGQLIRR